MSVPENDNYDLAILHKEGDRVVLTEKAEPGEIGSKKVFEFEDWHDLKDFIAQLEAVGRDVWGEKPVD
jgi:hypothetical protein